MGPKVRWRDAAKKGQPDYLACYRTWKGESDEHDTGREQHGKDDPCDRCSPRRLEGLTRQGNLLFHSLLPLVVPGPRPDGFLTVRLS